VLKRWSVGSIRIGGNFNTSALQHSNTISPPRCWRSPTSGRKQPIFNGQGTEEYRYLHHNRKAMKTIHTTDRNIISNHARVRFVLTLAGIVIAVLCSLALWQEARSAERIDTRVPHLLEFSRLVATDLVGEVKTWM
jgi:hypothetical protein